MRLAVCKYALFEPYTNLDIPLIYYKINDSFYRRLVREGDSSSGFQKKKCIQENGQECHGGIR